MKDGDDKEFVEIITHSGLGTIERLPKNCQATHVFRVKGQDRVLPVKYIREVAKERWNLLTSDYRGVLVLWLSAQEFVLVIHTSQLTTGRTRSTTIINQYNVSNYTKVVSELLTVFKAYSVALKDVMALTKYKVVTREENLLRPSTNGLEASAHEEIIALVGSEHWKETPEKCRADAVFYVEEPDFSLPLQTKTCTFKKDGKALNIFHNTSGYEGMILLCRPMTRLYIGTVIIPGVLAPNDINLTLSEGSKYMQYLIPDIQLKTFLTGLHAAIIKKQATHIWPSGKEIDISDIKLVTYVSLCTPHYETDVVEQQNRQWRLKTLPGFNYEQPRVQGTWMF